MQYSDSGYHQAKTADEEAASPGKNPTVHENVDAMELVATGKLGSLLNTVGQARTNALQHAAVEKSRLHIRYSSAPTFLTAIGPSIPCRSDLRRRGIQSW